MRTQAGFAMVLGIVCHALAHGDHGRNNAQQPIVDQTADWATRHMAEEHHMSSFDAGSFFKLHDYDDSGFWTPEDILKTYGLKDQSTKHISNADKQAAAKKIIDLYDHDKDGRVSFAEYIISDGQGIKLPDFGYGPGHHGDDEYEYEIHHFEKYHSGPDVKEEDLVHPEDIEHFKMHEAMEDAQEAQEKMDRMSIVEYNIPKKFRRGG
ncbi:secretory pathway protein-like protein Ssp120 [Polychaeton citri CBS 116435]|uniref:Secretory pathway protein-like protein Ssp120 n=1 Tax=Polychaeton citri CBS 116435 TaxID=1314669 RepID=A0A9P4UMR4_9PEZI|nr:secretory pathway protein-like protein Ssp120 [Polychaeton citri CBS 116435]